MRLIRAASSALGVKRLAEKKSRDEPRSAYLFPVKTL